MMGEPVGRQHRLFHAFDTAGRLGDTDPATGRVQFLVSVPMLLPPLRIFGIIAGWITFSPDA